jgi:hypothetical protein
MVMDTVQKNIIITVHRTYYRTVVYKPPKRYYKKHYYRPVRRVYYAPRPQRVYPARPVVIVNL